MGIIEYKILILVFLYIIFTFKILNTFKLDNEIYIYIFIIILTPCVCLINICMLIENPLVKIKQILNYLINIGVYTNN